VSLWIKHHRFRANLASQFVMHNVLDGLSHYKNSGGLATFTENSDQRLGCCINNV
jgi:hypothetical protein